MVCRWGGRLAQAAELRLCCSKKSTNSCHVTHLSRAFKDAGDGHSIERGGDEDDGSSREGKLVDLRG